MVLASNSKRFIERPWFACIHSVNVGGRCGSIPRHQAGDVALNAGVGQGVMHCVKRMTGGPEWFTCITSTAR
jgi:hypothetical protein